MVQKEVILIILIAIVIYLICNNDKVSPIIKSIPRQLNTREFMTSDLNNDMYLMDVANMNNNKQLDNSFMFYQLNEESEKRNNHKRNSGENLYGQANDENMNDENMNDGNMHDGNMHDGNMHDGNMHEGNMHEENMHDVDKLYGDLYGKALQTKIEIEAKEENMQDNREKRYGSMYGQALQNGKNNSIPMPMDMSLDFNNQMPLNMDSSMDMSKFGEKMLNMY